MTYMLFTECQQIYCHGIYYVHREKIDIWAMWFWIAFISTQDGKERVFTSLQQYFSHSETMGGWTWKALCNEAPFRFGKNLASRRVPVTLHVYFHFQWTGQFENSVNEWVMLLRLKVPIPGESTRKYRIIPAGRVAGYMIGCASAWYAESRRFDPKVRQNILSLRFGHEKNSTTILSLPLIQEGQLSVTGKIMGAKYW